MYGQKAIKAIMREIGSLKSKLNEINAEKEKWFKLKEELKKPISDMINRIRGVKEGKDKSSVEIQKLRAERDDSNKNVGELISRIKELNKEKKVLFKKHGIKSDPLRIKENIESIDRKIETEALSFKKEQKLMEEIKKLKKSLESTKIVEEIVNKIKEVSKQIDAEREKANEAHRKLKQLMKSDKKEFKEFISLSKEIGACKKKQENAFREFINCKKKFDEVNRQLREKLESAGKAKSIENERHRRYEIFKEAKEQKIIEEKVKNVEEKLKAKQKLTTEDLIVFQGKKDL